MNGHPRPRRTSAGPNLLPSRRRCCLRSQETLFPAPALFSVILLVLLLALLLTATPLLAGCGGGEAAAKDAAPTLQETTTTASEEVPSAPKPTTGQTSVGDVFPVTVSDDNGKSVTIAAKPVRIVSTAPANTEMLFALGVGERVVGVNSLDNYPPEVADIAKVGDYQANTEAVMALSPDLVVGYAGNEEELAPVEDKGAPVIIFNPTTIDGVYANITTLGAATGASAAAAELVESIKAEIAKVAEAAKATGEAPKVFYALDNTLWTPGPGSFVDEMLSLANCVNIGSGAVPPGVTAQAYYQLTPEQLVAADPDVVLLPSVSGYSSADEFMSDPRFAGLSAVKQGRVYLFDDTMATRPGPRIGQGLQVLVGAIHPGAL